MSEKPTDPGPLGTEAEGLAGMLGRAEAGDPAAAEWVKKILNQPEVVTVVGDLTRKVESAALDRLVGEDLVYRGG